jgi:hypothetical protein
MNMANRPAVIAGLLLFANPGFADELLTAPESEAIDAERHLVMHKNAGCVQARDPDLGSRPRPPSVGVGNPGHGRS